MFAQTLKLIYLHTTTPKLILQYRNFLNKYSFLNIDFKNVESIDLNLLMQNSQEVYEFRKKLLKHRKEVESLSNRYISLDFLKQIQSKGVGGLGFIDETQKLLYDIAKEFQKLPQQLKVKSSNLTDLLLICSAFQINCMSIWIKILNHYSKYYHTLPSKKKRESLELIYKFISNYFPRLYFTTTKKFHYKENYTLDLHKFTILSNKVYHDFILLLKENFNNEKSVIKYQQIFDILKEYVKFISNLYQKINFNVLMMIQLFKEHQDYVMEGLRLINNFEYTLQILKLLTIIKLKANDNLFELLLQQYNQKFVNVKSLLFRIHPLKIIITYYSNLAYYHPKIYTTIIKPFLTDAIKYNTFNDKSFNDKSVNVLSIMVHNMLTIPIKEPLVNQFRIKVNQIYKNKQVMNLHISNHFYGVNHKTTTYDNYKCFQNPILKEIIQRKGQVFSDCMNQFQGSQTNQINQKKINRQYSTSEDIWYKIISLAFKTLKSKYPHPKNSLTFHLKFCQYQIDYFLIINDIPIAVQLYGIQYIIKERSQQDKDNSKKGTPNFTGRKKAKMEIISAYGIEIMELYAYHPVVHYLMGKGEKSTLGAKYFVEEVEKIINKCRDK